MLIKEINQRTLIPFDQSGKRIEIILLDRTNEIKIVRLAPVSLHAIRRRHFTLGLFQRIS
jgi:hypothetical protein